MRYRSLAVVTACACAGLTVAGCSSQSSASAPGITEGTPVATSPASTGAPAASVTPAASATPGTGSSAQASATCQPGGLRIAFGSSTGAAGSQQTMVVDLTNTGSSACTMDGFPGVNLVGSALGKTDYTWPLARASQAYQRVTLQPGGSAHFDLMYLPGSTGTGAGSTNLAVSTLVVTPPNDYSHAQLTWKQSVLLQDGATHPGTFITPVASGA